MNKSLNYMQYEVLYVFEVSVVYSNLVNTSTNSKVFFL